MQGSTRDGRDTGRGAARPRLGAAAPADPAEALALVAAARREQLLRIHRHRLRREDLEDCYSQATLELVVQARAGRAFAGGTHLLHALEQRFLARVQDRRRAVAGRSPMQAAIEGALPLAAPDDGPQLGDTREEPERLVLAREQLELMRSSALQLSDDQRLVLAAQLAGIAGGDLCRREGWSESKYRKVAQRGRARLRALMGGAEHVPFSAGRRRQQAGTASVIAGLRIDTSHDGTDIGPNRGQDGPRWRIYPEIPGWARWSVRHPPGL